MQKILHFFLVLLLCQLSYGQCTPAALRETAPLNTPPYALNTAFNVGNGNGFIDNLSNGVVDFTGSVSGGSATWNGGVQIQNDAIVGNHIYVQPQNTDNVTTLNDAVYTFDFSEQLFNMSFRIGGLNNLDQARITAFNGATPITITAANFSNIVNDPGNGGTIVITGNTIVGNNTAGSTNVLTNRVTVSIAGPVTRIVVEMGKSDDGNGTVTIGFTSVAYTRCVSVPPDVNATFVNTAVTGNVGTNDIKPAGTTYGAATTQPGYTNPSASTPTINSSGSYTFTPTAIGVYKFLVPMCIPGVVSPDCPLVPLVITVTNPVTTNNNPVANIDRATTPINMLVTLNTLANDKAGSDPNIGLNPASVTVTTAPKNGTTTVDPTTGNINYTPNNGFVGFDTLTYNVCDLATPTPQCATAIQIITIEPAASSNTTTATDDYNSTPLNTAVSGTVKANDNDVQNNSQTVTAQNTTVPGKGTLALNTNGTYTFTPFTGYSGPINFPYETCDNGAPSVCANATLYILIFPTNTLPLDFVSFRTSVNNSNVVASWVAANQTNVNRYEIERSPADNVSFLKVGTVQAINNALNTYTFTDFGAKNYITKGLYRVKVIDNDGRSFYSKTNFVNFENGFTISVFPNIIKKSEPVNVITTGNSNGKIYYGVLYNNNGMVIKQWSQIEGIHSLNTNDLSSGNYFIKITSGKEIKTLKLLVN